MVGFLRLDDAGQPGAAVLCLPWNDPVAIAAPQIAANLAVGNTMV